MFRNSVFDQPIAALFSRPRIQGFSLCKSTLLVFVGLLIPVLHPVSCSGQDEVSPRNPVEIGWRRDADDQLVVAVDGLKKPAAAKVNVWVEGANQATDPPLAGTLEAGQNRVVFRPRFPLLPGMTYHVAVKAGDAKLIRATIRLPSVPVAASEVTAIYPSSSELPENLLKFYVHFSKPMRKGDVYRYFRLRESDGNDVELPFLEIEQEFWSRDSKRLTLLLDPGRIKRGLKPREDMGPILSDGQDYELVIDGNWPDTDGKKLGNDVVKRFRAISEDQHQPDPAEWKMWLPQANSNGPLVIRFPEPLDHSMLFGSIVIRDGASNVMKGSIKVTDFEKRWAFEPAGPWLAGSYSISINSDLEDNSGNSVGRQFDVDVFEKTESPDDSLVIEWNFQISK